MKRFFRALLPAPLLSLYHLSLALFGALRYGFPSHSIRVIAVTGTKGKSSTIEYINAVFEAAGYRTALINSIRVKVAERSETNPSGRSTPGRFFIQTFLRDALRARCDIAILEMTSEGARQHRHRGISFDALVFTNLAPEHIESHGSFEKYADAKFALGEHLARSRKLARIMVANAADAHSARYLALPVEKKIGFVLEKNAPLEARADGGYFTFDGTRMDVRLPGTFSLLNALAAAEVARAFGLSADAIRAGLASLARIPGRAEEIREGQDFSVVVDYAHTPDSLQALYDAYAPKRRICVVSATGGGRDKWKRPLMGKIADANCAHVIITDEDPYDEEPLAIMKDVAAGCARTPEMIESRREAVRRALALAKAGDAVLISGKGTDTAIHRKDGSEEPWDDAAVVREELKKR